MTMIISNMPQGAILPDGINNSGDPSVDGAMAIFDAIMAAVADWHGGDIEEMDMQTKAETVASQIMSDDSLKFYLDDTGKADLLPFITDLLNDTEIVPDHHISSLNYLTSENQNQIEAVSDAPIANSVVTYMAAPKSNSDNITTEDKEAPASGHIAENSYFQLSKSNGRQPRDLYETAKNPVQILASLIRKTEGKISDMSFADPVQAAPLNSDIQSPVPMQVDVPTPVISTEPVIPVASPIALKPSQTPLTPHVTDLATHYGPFPKTTPEANLIKDTVTNHMSMSSAEIKGDNSAAKPVILSHVSKPEAAQPIRTDMGQTGEPALKTEYARHPDNMTADMTNVRNRATQIALQSDESTIMASAIKSQNASSTPLSQNVSVSSSSSTMTLAHMTDTEHQGGFSGQQQNGQQNPQQSQTDTTIDTRMGLDQGKDGRLLRLNINDANWTDRLLRNIQSQNADGSNDTIRVILEPAKLGRLIVKVSVAGNNTNVQITSATAEAAAILADAEPKLQQVFEQHGLKLGQMQTSMGQGFSNQWSQGQGSSSSERNNKTGTKNATQDEEESTKTLENAKTGQVNILA